MKKIQLERINEGNKKSIYTIRKKTSLSLYNGQAIPFNNKRKAKQALSQVNKEINNRLDDINLLFMEIILEYRRVWRHVSPEKGNYFRDHIKDIDRMLHKCTEQGNTPNINHFIFHYTYICMDYCANILQELSEIHRKTNNWMGKRLIDAMIERTKALRKEVDKIWNL